MCLICEFTPEGDAATRAASAPPAPPGALGGGPAPVTPAAVDPLQSSGGSGAAGPQPGSEYVSAQVQDYADELSCARLSCQTGLPFDTRYLMCTPWFIYPELIWRSHHRWSGGV